MKLRKVLSEMKESQKIKVGCVDGNGYFYCGTVDDLESNMLNYTDTVRKHFERKMQRAKDNRLFHQENKWSVISYVRTEINAPSPKPSMDGYMRYLEKYFKRLDTLLESERRAKQAFIELKPLSNWEVDESFPADMAIEGDCMIIMVEGRESGRFWMTEEAKGCQLAFDAIDTKREDESEHIEEDENNDISGIS